MRRAEQGFTMIATVLGTSLAAVLVLVAVSAVNGDVHQVGHDLEHKQAYEAAKAGVDDYAFHLHANGNYWGLCTEVPAPNAVNQQGSQAKTRPVPGGGGAKYAIELLPAEGHSSCETNHPTTSMIETTGPMKGTFRIRSTGYDGEATVAITTTFKSASFLDYVYFTQLETSDPVTYGYPNPSEELTGAYAQCQLTEQQGRYLNYIPNTNPKKKCNKIVFKSGDAINGPLHSNDTLAICGNPTFGRNKLDAVETSATAPGWISGDNPGTASCPTANPQFLGSYTTGAPALIPPATNSELKTITEPAFRFTGTVHICLSGTSMTVAANSTCEKGIVYSGPIPSNGLVYVSNSSCSTPYSPFTTKYTVYPETSGCGTAFVHGTYTGQLTIATENDIIIDGNICRSSCTTPTGSGMLGLIANNFVRVFHAYSSEFINSTSDEPECGSGGKEETLKNVTIDAAILSINHSFIVDHYDCGTSLGTLKVEGAISQKYRGPVGTSGGTGYTKSYNYDDRLRYLEPPNFIEPEKLPWLIGRETTG